MLGSHSASVLDDSSANALAPPGWTGWPIDHFCSSAKSAYGDLSEGCLAAVPVKELFAERNSVLAFRTHLEAQMCAQAAY